MSKSQQSQDGSPATGAKLAIRPKTVAFVLMGIAAIGLTLWGMSSDSLETDDLVAEDEWVDAMKSPQGAAGDSAGGSTSESTPLVLPSVTPDGLATAGSAGRNTGLTGPLFNESISSSSTTRQGVSTAGFEQPMAAPPAGSVRPITGAPRVTANQPVWLTGTIEAAPAQGREGPK